MENALPCVIPSLTNNFTSESAIDRYMFTSEVSLLPKGEAPSLNQRGESRHSDLVESCASVIKALVEDPKRPELERTPERMAKALEFFTSGYELSVDSVVNNSIFPITSSDMVIIRDIDIFSMCEHHILPFFGKLHVGYIPTGFVIGLSKVVRIANIFARRLQTQERLGFEIAQAISDCIRPAGVAIIIQCQHLCMSMRGVQNVSAKTSTVNFLGTFRQNEQIRANFLSMFNCPNA